MVNGLPSNCLRRSIHRKHVPLTEGSDTITIIATDPAVTPIADILKDDAEFTRIYALGIIGDKSAVPYLKEALKTEKDDSLELSSMRHDLEIIITGSGEDVFSP